MIGLLLFVSQALEAPLQAERALPDLAERMGDPTWISRSPQNPSWSLDSNWIWFERLTPGRGISEVWRLPRSGGEAEPVALEDQHRVPPGRRRFDPSRERALFERGGDLYLQDLAGGEPRPLFRTAARESAFGFSADGRSVLFERGGALLARDLNTGLEEEWARFAFAADPDEDRHGDPEGYVPEGQERHSRILREQRERERARDEHRDRLEALDPFALPPVVYLDEDLERVGVVPSPSRRHVLIVAAESTAGGERDSMPEWVTESGEVESREVRGWVGERVPQPVRLFLLDVAAGEASELDLAQLAGMDEDPLAEVRLENGGEVPEDGEEGDEHSGGERGVRWIDARWTPSGSRLAVQLRSLDNKDRWIAEVDLENAKLWTLDRRHDPAWVGWLDRGYDWLRDESGIWFLSERTGFSQLYTRAGPTSPTRALTQGEFEVSEVEESRDGGVLYFRTNRRDPGAHELESLDLLTGERKRWTDFGGRIDFSVSPDGRAVRLLVSHWDHPPELWTLELEAGASPVLRTESRTPRFSAIDWVEPLWVDVPMVTADSGLPRGPGTIRGKVYLPPDTAPPPGSRGRPCVLFVHGAGYLQNAHRGWSGYYREFLFHDWLARRGVVVLDLDYRASAGYGRDWRTAIYRRMGEPELEDLLAGVAYATDRFDVDPERVGLYGGSYGGFMTLMALFRSPGTFAAGAALRPVTDWSHYNHGYTSNILNTPEVDPLAFLRSSPIEFADGLEDPLLICHGLLDDNVFAKDSIRLSQKLIELGKEDWELALYPMEPHGFREPSSWTDEYRRIAELFERHLDLEPLP